MRLRRAFVCSGGLPGFSGQRGLTNPAAQCYSIKVVDVLLKAGVIMLAFQLALQLILLILIGIFVQKSGMVDPKFDESLTAFLLNIALPCVILKSLNVEFSPEELMNCAVMIGLALLVCAVMGAVGQGFYLAAGRTAGGRILRFGAMFTNFTFVGMPVIETLYGDQGLFYFVVFTVPLRMLYYSLAKPMLSPPGHTHEKRSLLQHIKTWMCPPVVAVFIGLFLYITQLPLPGVLSSVISSVGSICSPLGMILCGISLGKYNIRAMARPRYLAMPLVRNMLSPAIFTGIMLLLPVEPLIAKVVVIYAALPCASLLAAFTIQYDPNPRDRMEAAGGVLLSTLLSAATIPLWAAVADYLL